jgi:hypothetical protein
MLAQLPPRDLFPREMPRYPNLWFLVDPAAALRRQYQYAVRSLVHALEQDVGLRDTFVRDVENHNLAHMLAEPGEGSDFQARLWPLPPRVDGADPSRSHGHQVHARFYVTPLIEAQRTRQSFSFLGEEREVFLVPASVHYEVSTEDPLHPYEDSCPLCGITGEYDVPVDPASQDYCVKIHDPLGIEVLLRGSVRGEPVLDERGRRIASLEALGGRWSCRMWEGFQEQGEPRRLGLVLLTPRPARQG